MSNPHAQRLVDAALPYWEAEGEIAKRFFASKPSREDQIYWLKAQVWKELHPVDGYFNGIHKELSRLTDLFPQVDAGVDRHDFGFALRQIVEEFNHYVLFADILQFLTGAPVGPAETVQLPAEKGARGYATALCYRRESGRCSGGIIYRGRRCAVVSRGREDSRRRARAEDRARDESDL
jgi:hypothetical protein